MTLILLIIGIFVNQLQAYFFGLFWIGLIFGGYILFQYRDYNFLKKTLDFNNEKLKSYQESFFLTNRRCILKSYKTFKYESKKFPNHEVKKDYFILKNKDIKSIIISSYKNMHTIWLSEKIFKKTIDWESFIRFEFPSDKFNNFFELLNDFLPLHIVNDSIENITQYRVIKETS
jgi:hypothetical protein